jgi:hypothetical protein
MEVDAVTIGSHIPKRGRKRVGHVANLTRWGVPTDPSEG